LSSGAAAPYQSEQRNCHQLFHLYEAFCLTFSRRSLHNNAHQYVPLFCTGGIHNYSSISLPTIDHSAKLIALYNSNPSVSTRSARHETIYPIRIWSMPKSNRVTLSALWFLALFVIHPHRKWDARNDLAPR
jgi:hypothetical protein